MFAFGLTTTALRFLILSNYGPRERRATRNRIALSLLTLAGIVFRSELALLLATESAWLFLIRKVSIRHVIIPAGILSMTLALLLTISVDSFFWQRFPLWPEWVAFRFNTLEGKSAEWGTSPWYFYFINAIPRLMLNPVSLLLCIPLALLSPSTRPTSIDILAPLLAFIALYSILPHKEWRFILYVVPALTAVAAAGASWIWIRRAKSTLYRLLSLALIASVLASFAASTLLLAVSSLNYPGAHALLRLHNRADGERPLIRVHLDNLACQTGVTRFLQRRVDPARAAQGVGEGEGVQTVWYYDKTEDEASLVSKAFWERFDYVIAEDVEDVLGKWEVVESVEGYAGMGVGREGRRLGEIFLAGERGGGMVDRALRRVVEMLLVVEDGLRRYVTGGRWLIIRMEPRLHILKKVE